MKEVKNIKQCLHTQARTRRHTVWIENTFKWPSYGDFLRLINSNQRRLCLNNNSNVHDSGWNVSHESTERTAPSTTTMATKCLNAIPNLFQIEHASSFKWNALRYEIQGLIFREITTHPIENEPVVFSNNMWAVPAIDWNHWIISITDGSFFPPNFRINFILCEMNVFYT